MSILEISPERAKDNSPVRSAGMERNKNSPEQPAAKSKTALPDETIQSYDGMKFLNKLSKIQK